MQEAASQRFHLKTTELYAESILSMTTRCDNYMNLHGDYMEKEVMVTFSRAESYFEQ